MTAEIDLLPLPEWMSRYTIPTDGFEYGEGVMLDDCMRDYARANVARNTALLRAEIEALRTDNLRTEVEALRAEVAEWKRVAAAQAELHGEAEARAERLAEALRKLEEREQRDEALLRQALEALELRCGTHADERKKLIPALRERLGEGGRDDLSQGD